jgi:competence protein ComGC
MLQAIQKGLQSFTILEALIVITIATVLLAQLIPTILR